MKSWSSGWGGEGQEIWPVSKTTSPSCYFSSILTLLPSVHKTTGNTQKELVATVGNTAEHYESCYSNMWGTLWSLVFACGLICLYLVAIVWMLACAGKHLGMLLACKWTSSWSLFFLYCYCLNTFSVSRGQETGSTGPRDPPTHSIPPAGPEQNLLTIIPALMWQERSPSTLRPVWDLHSVDGHDTLAWPVRSRRANDEMKFSFVILSKCLRLFPSALHRSGWVY